MEERSSGILGIRAEINDFDCQNLLSFNFVQDKLIHYFHPVKLFSISLGPLFHGFN
jgi:hypothetical protein